MRDGEVLKSRQHEQAVKFCEQAIYPDSLPIRALVEISQALAALTQISLSALAIIERATADRRTSSANHHNKAWVSNSSFTARLLVRMAKRLLLAGSASA